MERGKRWCFKWFVFCSSTIPPLISWWNWVSSMEWMLRMRIFHQMCKFFRRLARWSIGILRMKWSGGCAQLLKTFFSTYMRGEWVSTTNLSSFTTCTHVNSEVEPKKMDQTWGNTSDISIKCYLANMFLHVKCLRKSSCLVVKSKSRLSFACLLRPLFSVSKVQIIGSHVRVLQMCHFRALVHRLKLPWCLEKPIISKW